MKFRRTFGKSLTLVFSAILLCWLLFFCFRTGRLIIDAYNALPVMDYWETVPHLDGYRHFPPVVFWQQHYEHRVIFPEMVFAFDWLFLKGREVLPLALTTVLDIAIWIILVLAYRDSGGTATMWCALFLAGIILAWPGVAFVLAFPFSLQFLLYQFTTTASLWALSKKRVVWAIVLGVIASFSSANGLFVWPVLGILALGMRLRRAQWIGIGCVGAISVAAFFTSYRNIGNMHPEELISHTRKFLGYFLMYLGMPFGAAGVLIGLIAGVFSLAVFAWLAWMAWHRKQITSPLVIICLGVCLLTVLTALITTTTRLPLDRRSFEQAVVIPGRYVNFGAHYWAALTVLLVWTAGQFRPRFQWACVLSLTLFFASTLSRTDSWVKFWMTYYASYQYATLAIESGLATEQTKKFLNYSDAGLVTRSLGELERRHLSLYSWDRYKLVGKTIASASGYLGAELPQQQASLVQEIEGGVRIVGWSRPKSYVAVVDASGTIVGLGRHLPGGETLALPIPAGHSDDYWVAFAGRAFQRETSRFYLLPQ